MAVIYAIGGRLYDTATGKYYRQATLDEFWFNARFDAIIKSILAESPR